MAPKCSILCPTRDTRDSGADGRRVKNLSWNDNIVVVVVVIGVVIVNFNEIVKSDVDVVIVNIGAVMSMM